MYSVLCRHSPSSNFKRNHSFLKGLDWGVNSFPPPFPRERHVMCPSLPWFRPCVLRPVKGRGKRVFAEAAPVDWSLHPGRGFHRSLRRDRCCTPLVGAPPRNCCGPFGSGMWWLSSSAPTPHPRTCKHHCVQRLNRFTLDFREVESSVSHKPFSEAPSSRVQRKCLVLLYLLAYFLI